MGIVMDSKGNVFYTDLVHVWKISAEGELSIAVKDVHTHQLHIDENDNLYGEHVWYEGEETDEWTYYVWCLDQEGELSQTIPPTRGFPVNNTLVRDSDGNSYFPVKSGDKEFLKIQSDQGDTLNYSDESFNDIRWVFWSKPHQEVLLIDHLTLKSVNSEGRVKIISDLLHDKAPNHGDVNDRHYLMGVWTDKSMNIYTAAYGARKVKRISPDGTLETVYKSPVGWSPCGGLIDDQGKMWVMEFSVFNKTRVRKIIPGGKDKIFKT